MIEVWLKRLSQPLSVPMRQRLEVALAVVATAAAIVALSRVVRPDPSKLASASIVIPTTPSTAPRYEKPYLRPDAPLPPKVSPEFAAAVAAGDLAAMERLYAPRMPLDGMLFTAADSGNAAVVQWLLDHGADVHEGEESASAPVLVADDHSEIATLLLERGANEPSLAIAASAGAPNAVTRLLAKRVSVNSTYASPLVEAVSSTTATRENKKLIVEKLLAAGADPNLLPLSGREEGSAERALTAAVRACDVPREDGLTHSCVAIIELLVARGARADGETLSAATTVDDLDHGKILDAVLAARLEPGATAIALTRMRSEMETSVLEKVTAKGVDWAWRDGEDDAALPLVAAVQRADREGVRALLDAGAPADRHFKNGTCALGEALDQLRNDGSGEYARIVELLIARGADVNRRLPDGRSPLFAAAEAGDVRVINALLDRGARVNELVLDDAALDAAEQGGHVPAARVLHARGGRRANKPGVRPWETP